MTKKDFIDLQNEYGFEYAVSELPVFTMSREAVEEEVKEKIDEENYAEAIYILSVLDKFKHCNIFINKKGFIPVFAFCDIEMYLDKGE